MKQITAFSFVSCEQREVKSINSMMDKFEEFKKKEKFTEDTTIFYPGITDASVRLILAKKINLSADDFKELAATEKVTEKDCQEKIKIGLQRFSDIYPNLDTEDRERVCHYFEELMTIAGLASSNGYLNSFMYGFDPLKK